MGSRSIRIVVDAWVDKGDAIDIANEGGEVPSIDDWPGLIGWLGAAAQDGGQIRWSVSTPSPHYG